MFQTGFVSADENEGENSTENGVPKQANTENLIKST